MVGGRRHALNLRLASALLAWAEASRDLQEQAPGFFGVDSLYLVFRVVVRHMYWRLSRSDENWLEVYLEPWRAGMFVKYPDKPVPQLHDIGSVGDYALEALTERLDMVALDRLADSVENFVKGFCGKAVELLGDDAPASVWRCADGRWQRRREDGEASAQEEGRTAPQGGTEEAGHQMEPQDGRDH